MTGPQKILNAIAEALNSPAADISRESRDIALLNAIFKVVKSQQFNYRGMPGAYTDRQWPWAYSMALANAALEIIEDAPAGQSHTVIGAALFPLAKAHLAAVAADVVAAKACLKVEQMRLPL